MNALDLQALVVGQALPPLVLPPITRLQLALYCGGSGDHNPIHVDSDYAKQHGLDDVMAHGMLSMNFAARLLTARVPQRCIKRFGVRFLGRVQIGDVLTIRAQVAAVDHRDGTAHVTLECTNQHGTATLRGNALLALSLTPCGAANS